MKIFAIKNIGINTNVKNQNRSETNYQNTMSDSFTKSRNASKITFKGVASAEEISKYLELLAKKKAINIKEQNLSEKLQVTYKQGIDNIKEEIALLTKDTDFVADTVHSEKEKNSWVNIVNAIMKTSDKNYDELSVDAMNRASEVINNNRLRTPEEFLKTAPQKLDDEVVDAKFQNLKGLYTKLVKAKTSFEKVQDSLMNHFYKEGRELDLGMSEISLNKDYKQFQREVIDAALKKDPELKQKWKTDYWSCVKKPITSRIPGQVKDFARYYADKNALESLNGVKDLPF